MRVSGHSVGNMQPGEGLSGRYLCFFVASGNEDKPADERQPDATDQAACRNSANPNVIKMIATTRPACAAPTAARTLSPWRRHR